MPCNVRGAELCPSWRRRPHRSKLCPIDPPFLQDVRYRQRYLDGIVNNENMRRVFTTRARIVQFVRRYLDQRDFLEVRPQLLLHLKGARTWQHVMALCECHRELAC